MRSSETWVWEGSHEFRRRETVLSRLVLSEEASCFIRDRPTSDLSSSMETQMLELCFGLVLREQRGDWERRSVEP